MCECLLVVRYAIAGDKRVWVGKKARAPAFYGPIHVLFPPEAVRTSAGDDGRQLANKGTSYGRGYDEMSGGILIVSFLSGPVVLHTRCREEHVADGEGWVSSSSPVIPTPY